MVDPSKLRPGHGLLAGTTSGILWAGFMFAYLTVGTVLGIPQVSFVVLISPFVVLWLVGRRFRLSGPGPWVLAGVVAVLIGFLLLPFVSLVWLGIFPEVYR
jgi:hypothetical protein